MAVYTPVDKTMLKSFLANYAVGELVTFRGITAGVENSNYLIQTTADRFILTIYEKRTRPEDLPFFLELMQYLYQRDIPCPTPINTVSGTLVSTIANKPAALIRFLEGASAKHIRNEHLHALGAGLAELHLAGRDFPLSRPNDFSLHSWQLMAHTLGKEMNLIKPGLHEEIQHYLTLLNEQWPKDLPHGIIHADAFPDNVFFHGATLAGIIDFYFACTDAWLYDVAICLNAWCFEHGKEFNLTKAKGFLQSYHAVRSIEETELRALPVLALGAAMRFFLTRAQDWLRQDHATVTPHNPMDYVQILRFHHGVKSYREYGL